MSFVALAGRRLQASVATAVLLAFVVVVVVVVGAAGAGCKGSLSPSGPSGVTGGSGGSGKPGGDAGAPDGDGADRPEAGSLACASGRGSAGAGAGAVKGQAETCTCNGECQSGFCADGVCCTSACAGGCRACNLPTSLGVCRLVPAGVKPNNLSTCAAGTPATCGLDGTCDGGGGCRKYVRGTECRPGTCESDGDGDGDGILGGLACDGNGACLVGTTKACFPYSCDPSTGRCAGDCTTNAQCAAGQQCAGRSCGTKMNGSVCAVAGDCTSGHCAGGVCCNVACAGPCVSCAAPEALGRCRFVDAGLPGPGCRANDRSTCDTTGLCDGFGSCALFPQDTPCGAATCSGSLLLNTARGCDGQGTCQPSRLIDCAPFRCENGACNRTCMADAQCEDGHQCVPTAVDAMTIGLCGKKKMGQGCAGGIECQSGMCIDGVCCESTCMGPCRSCALPSSMGQCRNVAAAAVDPRDTCSDEGRTSCGTDGLCDGRGACQRYAVGFACGDETCQLGSYAPPRTCNAAGQCVTPPSRTCNPYVCNGSACFSSCTDNGQCVEGRFCVDGSCGLQPLGADCSGAAECQSGFCAQGACCNAACGDACRSCALGTTRGLCTAVPDGQPDPQMLCAMTAAATCGTTGSCRLGACAFRAGGQRCRDPLCATTSSATPVSTCNGTGSCVTPTNQSCGTFACNPATGACRNSCASDAECVAPNSCVAGSCGLKAPGAACTAGNQCASSFCTQGVCCNSACSDAAAGGRCMSCTVAGKVGACSPVAAAGADPRGRCTATSAAAGNCANDGTCDGNGACRAWSAGTGCRQQSCTGNTFTPAASCNGTGACPAAATQMCNPFTCSASSPSCLTTCTANSQCTDGLTCVRANNRCGNKLGNGQACAAAGDCSSGFCTEGVCCNSACANGCQSCASTGTVGTCASIANGTAPRVATMCPAGALNGCGNTGRCNGNAGCQLDAAGAACGSASCAPATAGSIGGVAASQSLAVVPAPTCNGMGACTPSAPADCGNFQCNAATAVCKTSCTATSADCNALAPDSADPDGGNSCVGGTCQKLPSGSACTGGFACATGNCVDGRCCGSPSCGGCLACNVANAAGAFDGVCRAVAAGTVEPHARCPVTADASCGTDGRCTGAAAGVCERWNGTTCTPPQTTCVDARHMVAASGTCGGAGTCAPGAPVACGNGFLCVAGTCAASCTAANASTSCDTAMGFSCIGGVCAKVGQGMTCSSGAACASGNCIDGVCCASPSCADCSSCNVAGFAGACHAVAPGVADGACVGLCSTSGRQAAGLCDGAGACLGPSGCQAGYLCAGGVCATSCMGGGVSTCDGAAGYACASGVCKKAQGQGCSLAEECGSTFCSQGVCCNEACAGACRTCVATAGTPVSPAGTCTSLSAGEGPRPVAPAACAPAPPCGNTGACSGAGVCQVAPPGSACSSPSCADVVTSGAVTGGRSTAAGICDGTCLAPAPVDCLVGYACNGAACATSCSGPGTHCAAGAGYRCAAGGACKKTEGQSCAAAGDCASGACVPTDAGQPGVCCATACADSTCGSTTFCLPSGAACRIHADGELCGAATCSADQRARLPAALCSAGACAPPEASVPCVAGYLCSGAGACATSCGSDQSCDAALGYGCDLMSQLCTLPPPV